MRPFESAFKRAAGPMTMLAGMVLIAILLGGCGEGTLPPPPPPDNGTINISGEAV